MSGLFARLAQRSVGAAPLIERNPLLFWKGLSFVLACAVLLLAAAFRYGLGR